MKGIHILEDLRQMKTKFLSTTVELTFILSQHIEDYKIYVSTSSLSALNTKEGHQLKKALEARYVTIIAIGGSLGTGLLIGTG